MRGGGAQWVNTRIIFFFLFSFHIKLQMKLEFSNMFSMMLYTYIKMLLKLKRFQIVVNTYLWIYWNCPFWFLNCFLNIQIFKALERLKLEMGTEKIILVFKGHSWAVQWPWQVWAGEGTRRSLCTPHAARDLCTAHSSVC